MDVNQSWQILQTKSLDTLTWFLDKLQQGGDIAFNGMGSLGNELILLVREVAIYHAIYNWSMFAVYLCIIGTIYKLNRKFLRSILDYDDKHKSIYGGVMLIASITTFIVSVCSAREHLSVATKATFAPRYFVVEEVARLVKETQGK